jgi:thiamine-phosphate pyrophosphorylase
MAHVPFVVNDRPDIALALGADGVHLGQDDLAPAVAREIVGPDVVIGRSTHSTADIDRACDEHATGLADYIAVGPVYETPTKAGRPAVGPDLLREAAARARFPWFAIGGINPMNVGGLIGEGVRRVVVVRAITESADPIRAVVELRTALL